jgi:RNA polymerase sigma-70 factor (ECF subfamily)
MNEPTTDPPKRLEHEDPLDPDRIFERYARRLTRVAEECLSKKLAGRLDGEDVVQSVFRTFFRRSAEGEFQIDGSAQLWRLLVRITVLKARAKARYHTAGVRDVAAEAAALSDSGLAHALDREPGPAEAAALVDEIETLLKGLPDVYCRLLEMRLQGFKAAEIAAKLNLSRQSVYRALDLLQQRLEQASGEVRGGHP